jgi:hypothetical protein
MVTQPTRGCVPNANNKYRPHDSPGAVRLQPGHRRQQPLPAGAAGPDTASAKALEEFDGYVDCLRQHGVEVLVVQDTPEPHTPDSIFPNNWWSSHADGSLVLYPMEGQNRRLERSKGVLGVLTSVSPSNRPST